MKEKTRKRLFLWARILIAIGAITYIILEFDLRNAWAKLTNPYPNLVFMGLAAVAFLSFMAFMSLRWYILSRARGHPYGFFYLYRSVLIHMLFNNVLPTTIGGDVYRVMDTGGHEGKGVAFSIVWTDRMIGFIAVFGFGFIASIVYTVMSHDFIFLAIFGGMFVVAISLTLAFLSERINKWVNPWLSKIRIFKYPLGEKFANAFKSITIYRNRKGALVAALFASLAVQLSIVAIWFFLFQALPEKTTTSQGIAQAQEGIDTFAYQLTRDTNATENLIYLKDSDSSGEEISKVIEDQTSKRSAPEEIYFRPNFVHFTVTIPTVNTVAMFSVGGWGLREATFTKVLTSFSAHATEAERKNLEDRYLATSLLFDALNLFFGLLGGLFLLFRRSGKKRKIS